jgi:hypothetical protein
MAAKTARKLTPNQEAFAAWLAIPRKDRVPATQGVLAAKLGVRENTLSDWKKKPEITALSNGLAYDELRRRIPEVLGALAREAEGGSFQHQQLFLKLLKEYEENVNINLDDKRSAIVEQLDELAQLRRARMAG